MLNSFATAALTSVTIVRVSSIVFTPTTPINTQAISHRHRDCPSSVVLGYPRAEIGPLHRYYGTSPTIGWLDLYRNRRGLAYGSLNMSTSLGSVIGALVSGLLCTTGCDKLVITSVTVQVISLLALLLLWKTYLPYDVLREKPVITVITPKE